jgi:hypothetical protein
MEGVPRVERKKPGEGKTVKNELFRDESSHV